MDDVIAQTINSSVSVAEYQGVVKSYAPLPYDQNALGKLKQCFLDQSEETLANIQVMVVIIHFSFLYYITIYICMMYTYIHTSYICTNMYFIHFYLFIFILHTYLYTHMYIFPLMRKNNFQRCD
ncbi:Secretoglobin family 2A member 2 [Lemmus lemmus]